MVDFGCPNWKKVVLITLGSVVDARDGSVLSLIEVSGVEIRTFDVEHTELKLELELRCLFQVEILK